MTKSARAQVNQFAKTNYEENYYGQPIASGLKEVSNLKGDLILNKFVARSDLMKMYHLPVKKFQLPQNNPFKNLTLLNMYQTAENEVNFRKLVDSKGHDETLSYLKQQQIKSRQSEKFNSIEMPNLDVTRKI